MKQPKQIRRLSPQVVANARKAKDALARRLTEHPDVVGIGVGFRERKGRLVQTCCIRVHVRRKFHIDSMPKDLLLPRTFHGFPVDVVQSAFRSHSASNPSARFDPLVGGIVVANARRFQEDRSIGTAGCVLENAAGDALLISNWHVLYGKGGPDGETVVQPRSLGVLNNIGVTLKGILNENVDCAVALLNKARGHSREILGINGDIGSSVAALPGMLVRKSGANGPGFGFISSVHLGILVDIQGTLHSFIEQLEISPRPGQTSLDLNVDSGDSGSLWVSDPGCDVVGLHVGGGQGRAVANRMEAVVAALSAEGIDLGL